MKQDECTIVSAQIELEAGVFKVYYSTMPDGEGD